MQPHNVNADASLLGNFIEREQCEEEKKNKR